MISIILPTYNEVENSIPLIEDIENHVKDLHEIIVVDDDSPDGTSVLVKEYIRKLHTKHVRLITRKKDHGLTRSIQAGIIAARGDIVVWMDADFSHPPEIIPALVSQITTGYDMAIASRFVIGGQQKKADFHESALAIWLSTRMNMLLGMLLRIPIHDCTSGFIAVKRQVILSLVPLRGDYGEYCIDLVVRAHRGNYSLKEIPYTSEPRRAGTSKTAPTLVALAKRGIHYIQTILRLVYKKD